MTIIAEEERNVDQAGLEFLATDGCHGKNYGILYTKGDKYNIMFSQKKRFRGYIRHEQG